MDRKLTVAALWKSCTDGDTCPGDIYALSGVPGRFVIAKQVTDPAHTAALADRVGPGEVIGWIPDAPTAEA